MLFKENNVDYRGEVFFSKAIIAPGSDEAIYDFNHMKNKAIQEDKKALVSCSDLIISKMNKSGNILKYEMSWKDMISNYCYVLSVIHKEYYEYIEPSLKEYVDTMKEIINNNPNIIHYGEYYDNHVSYILSKDPANLHVFPADANIMLEFYKYKSEANNHYDQQKKNYYS